MNRDDVIRLAREADCLDPQHYGSAWADKLERFAELVAAAEREACAAMTVEFARKWWSIHRATKNYMDITCKAHDDFCALQAAIRARGE